MDILEYQNKKINEACNHIKLRFGSKHYYSYDDVLDLLKEFGNPFESDLVNVSNFIPSKGNDFTNINTFTKGFITEEDYKIVVLMLDKHFEVLVFGLTKGNFLNSYYSLNINNEVLNICYFLECMLPNKY
ncbi:MAG: hypothetical protein K6G28_05715 [Acholeplasmatales bacterium]|nr:hypothetical protein [Acholeplasmatales bacterium]